MKKIKIKRKNIFLDVPNKLPKLPNVEIKLILKKEKRKKKK